MRCDDRLAHGEADAYAVYFRGEEAFKDSTITGVVDPSELSFCWSSSPVVLGIRMSVIRQSKDPGA
jgi:hypothetical protein